VYEEGKATKRGNERKRKSLNHKQMQKTEKQKQGKQKQK
jgi:hypothetical protein